MLSGCFGHGTLKGTEPFPITMASIRIGKCYRFSILRLTDNIIHQSIARQRWESFAFVIVFSDS